VARLVIGDGPSRTRAADGVGQLVDVEPLLLLALQLHPRLASAAHLVAPDGREVDGAVGQAGQRERDDRRSCDQRAPPLGDVGQGRRG
jgi:hypothetical protein